MNWPVHPLLLQPQHHHHVGPGQRGVEIVERRDLHRLDPLGHQRGRRADAHFGAQRGQAQDVRARDPAVQDIAADRHRQAVDFAPLLRARMVSASSSAWVGCSCWPSPALSTGQSTLSGDQLHRARAAMADDDRIGAHRVERHRRVDQRLALFHARLRGVHVDHVGAQPLAGDLERQQRAGRVFEEGVDDRQPGQPVVALLRLAVEFDPLLRLVEQEQDLVRGEAGDARAGRDAGRRRLPAG